MKSEASYLTPWLTICSDSYLLWYRWPAFDYYTGLCTIILGKTLGCDPKIPLGCDAVPIPQLWRECLLFNQIWYQKTSNMYEWAIWPDERWNIARRFGKKHIWESKCTRHTNAGPLLEVHYVNSNSTPLHSTPLSSTPLHYTTLHHTTLHYVTLYSTALSYTTPTTTNTTTTTLPYATLHYTREQLWVR